MKKNIIYLVLFFFIFIGSTKTETSIEPKLKIKNKITKQHTLQDNIKFIDFADKKLSPYCAKLGQLKHNSTIEEVLSLFGPSEGGEKFISSCYESVHSLDNGNKLRIRVSCGRPGITAFYSIEEENQSFGIEIPIKLNINNIQNP